VREIIQKLAAAGADFVDGDGLHGADFSPSENGTQRSGTGNQPVLNFIPCTGALSS
jgi:hypothetical protein